jgi:flagellar basal body P-ring protein FlgI
MPEDKYEDEVYGIVVGLKGKIQNDKYFDIQWFDGMLSSEKEINVTKVNTDD